MNRRTAAPATTLVAAVTFALAATAGAGLGAAPAAQAAEGCRVDYSVASQWDSGFQASVTVTNLGSPLTGWNLTFTFPTPGQRVSQGWNATWTQSGTAVTAAGMSWNSSIATAASVGLGFIGSWSGSNPAPTGFAVNGVVCTGTPVTTSTSTTSTRPATTTTRTTTQTTTRPPTTSSTTTRTTTRTTTSSGCPASGHITYTLSRAASPTADQTAAYALITTAMDQALSVYNCHTTLTKALSVSYNPAVATADGNINGSIRFGARSTMQQITAMHEISHTLGVGTSSAWAPRLTNGVWTGTNATNQLRTLTGDPTAVIHGDGQHFWPYGLNYTSEVTSAADLVAHCRIVSALRQDMGL